jgi:hypothetical protein
MKRGKGEFVISHWRKSDNPKDLLREMRERYKSNPKYAKLLHGAASALLKGQQVVVEGKPNAQKVLRDVLGKLRDEGTADVPTGKAGKWQYLKDDKHRYTGTKVWQKVSRARAWGVCMDAGTRDMPLKLMRVLGYAADITREQARLIERAHFPKFIVLVEPTEERRDTAYDLDPQENEHFRDDKGLYDAAGVLQAPSRRSESEEAWYPYHEVGGIGSPDCRWSKAYRRISYSGAARTQHSKDHKARCVAEIKRYQRRAALGPNPPAYVGYSNEEIDAAAAHHDQLKLDEVEVRRYAITDAPETTLELLERELAETPGKAPKGLIAALAKERLAAQKRDELYRRHVDGFAALERAVSRV